MGPGWFDKAIIEDLDLLQKNIIDAMERGGRRRSPRGLKMRYVYTPEGAEPQSWEYDASRLLSPEAEAIERHTRLDVRGSGPGSVCGSMLAHHGLLFVLLKRSGPTLQSGTGRLFVRRVDFSWTKQDPAGYRFTLGG